MPARIHLSRREFLRLASLATPAALLGACVHRLSPATAIPVMPSVAPSTETPVAPSVAPPTAVPATPSVAPSKEPIDAVAPEMVLVEAGSFEMGSAEGFPDELPVHRIEITRPFFMGRCEVTFDEYDRFCREAARAKPDDRGYGRGKVPVVGVDWYDAVAFCNWLSEEHGLTPCYSGSGKGTRCDFTADGYRLPTEAEWEYAARGGQESRGYSYAGSNNPDEVGWYVETSGGRLRPVGEKTPNELGLHDMSGNAFEWCWDWYGADYYASSSASDPQGPPAPLTTKPWELVRVRRSGCWRENAESMRTTTRSYDSASYPGENGFRLARTVSPGG